MAEYKANCFDEYTDIAGDLPLGREDHKKFSATANEHLILEAGHLLQSLGDLDVEAEQTIRNEEAEQSRRRVSVKEYFSRRLKTIFETVDIVLEWLEKATDDGQPQQYSREFQKKENLLRGLYHTTGIKITLQAL